MEFLHSGYRTIALRKGMYKVKEKYYQLGANKIIIISRKGPGIQEEEIPSSVLYHRVME